MIKTFTRIVVLLVLLAPWLGQSHAADSAVPKFKEEITKQEQIYKSKGEDRPEGYVIDRSLSSYADTLPSDFDRSLANLRAKDRWLDIGAGMGQAILDYFAPGYDSAHEITGQRGGKARAVAMSIEDRRTPLWDQTVASVGANHMQYLFNRRLSEYSLEELGRFQVITDVIGGFSYTLDISRFMETVLNILDLDGSYYTVLQDVHSEDGRNKPYYANSPYLTEITNADGSELKVCSWLKSIGCVAVTCELKTAWKPPIEVYHIHKVCNEVSVPKLLPTHFAAGTPPERGFKLGK